MKLKRIELEGFKSFADRTVIPVQEGLTGIVGPNGCGKSNVVDALLWVMGERSAKALRADAMEDVIFKGAEGRAAGAFAMVEVVLHDEDGTVVEQGGEVAVGRRLFRTGESEFLLNGRRVRRKDVRDLLLDTGLGVRGYMLLAQGKIDAVLAANPVHRRGVFEEAAGISRYKARKAEALRKLEQTGRDLARVEDVLAEVQRSIRSLRYQAGKARRYQELREEYRGLRLRVAWSESTGLAEREEELRRRALELEEQLRHLREAREDQERKVQELQREESALRERHESLRAEAAAVKEEAAGLEERIRGLEARAAEREEAGERDRARLEELRRQCGEQGESLQELEAARAEAERALAECEREAAEREAVFEERRSERAALRERAEDLRRHILDLLQERTRWQNEMAAAAARRSQAEGALGTLERRARELEEERGRLHGAEEEARETLDEHARSVAASEERVRDLDAERGRLRQELEAHALALEEARHEASEARARLAALKAFDEEGQGLPGGVRRILETGRARLLLEGLRVPAPWDRILENLLGRLQHALWLEEAAALEALQTPEEVLDLFFPGAGPEPAGLPEGLPEGVRPLAELLEGEAASRDALLRRLPPAACAPDAATARACTERWPGVLFLAPEGEVHAAGYARLGILRGEESAGILARRNARQSAEEALRGAEERARGAEEAREAARARLAEVQAGLDALEGGLREALAGRERAQAEVRSVEKRRLGIEEQLRALALEAEQLRHTVAEAARTEEEARGRRDAAEAERGRLAEELQAAEACLAEAEERLEAASADLGEARREADRLRQEREHLGHRAGEARRVLEGQDREGDRLEAAIREAGAQALALREEAEAGRRRARELLERRAELEERVAEAAAWLEKAARTLEEIRSRAEDGGARLEELLEVRQELALERQRVQLEARELRRGIQEEFHQPLEDLMQSLGLEPDPEDREPERYTELCTRLAEVRRKLEGLGSVNLEAVEELEEREQRASFLESERQDLLQARARLEATVEELDGVCRERFRATFEAVRGQFEGIFRRLFRGGRASLELEEGADPLEAGIEIVARPPGKELRSINLLSGGERTLTALALLLAVFRSRPSPFCLLDEVDAALDDANVERFLDVLQDFTVDTQFMVVTHNKITMSRCQRLFGVTMRRAGVSTVVSVDLEDLPETSEEVLASLAPGRPRSGGQAAGVSEAAG